MRFRRLGVLATAAALILGLAAPAAARQVLFRDDSFDVAVDPRAPAQPLDISTIDVNYSTKQLTVAVSFGIGLGETLDGRWTTARLLLETTGDKNADYTLMARHANNLAAYNKPPAPPIATFFYGPNGKDLGRSGDYTKANAGKFVFEVGTHSPRTMTFTVPTASIGKPKQLKINLWVDLTDGSYGHHFGLDTYPDAKSTGAVAWSKPIATSKATTPTIKLNKTTVRKGSAATVTVQVTPKVAGTAAIFGDGIPGMQVKVAKGKTAKVTIPKKVTKKLKPGKYRLWVQFTPTSKTYATATSKPVTLTVKK